MASLYSYEPLTDTGSIRLLKLLPGSLQAPLQGVLTTISLSDPEIHFDALSYCWGNPYDEASPFHESFDTVQHEILINGSGLGIKQNLNEALLQMQEYGESLWVDAICIDQKNENERNQQILLMREIYSRARTVIVWLGRSDPTSDEAVQVIENSKEDAFLSLMYVPTAGHTVPKNEVGLIKHLSASQKTAVANFFLRTWFSRVWTLQEVLLTNRAIGYCGTTTLAIGDATLVAAALSKDEQLTLSNALVGAAELKSAVRQIHSAALIGAYMTCAWSSGGFGSRAFLRYPRIDHEMKISTTHKWLIALELLVNEVRSRQCTVVRDKIIAPLTFAMHRRFVPDAVTEKFGARINKVLRLDQSTESTYCNFTTFMIESMNSLDILSRIDRHCISDKDENSKTPSWVPNFTSTGTTSLIDNLLCNKYNASDSAVHSQISNGIEKLFQKHAACSHITGIQSLQLKLKVDAICFGKISKISSYWAKRDQIALWLQLITETFEGQRANVNDSALSTASPCGCDGIGSEDDIAFLVIKQSRNAVMRARRGYVDAVARFDGYLRSELSALSLAELSVMVHEQRKRRLFISLPGPLGLAPVLAQQDDFICILRGAKVPLVLRRLPGSLARFSLIGEAYLDGFMHGEISRLNLPVRPIVLV